jgi:predicted GNAT family acetyltransferase
MVVVYSHRAADTPAFALIAEGWNEMVQEGLTPDGVGVCPVKADDEVLYTVSAEGDIVGVLVYGQEACGSVIRVSLAYVEPSMRKRGVFKMLLAALKQSAVTREMRVEIQAPTNSLIQAVLRHLNTPVAAVVYEIAGAAQGA